MGSIGLEAAKVQLSGLMSKVSTQCLNSAFSGMKELSDLCLHQKQDCSIDSCLTSSCEGSLRDQELYNNLMALKPVDFRATTTTEMRDNDNNDDAMKEFFSAPNHDNNVDKSFTKELNTSNLSMSIGFQGSKWNNSGKYKEERFKEGDLADGKFLERQMTSSSELKAPFFSTRLDLNTDNENDAASSYKQLDLNGFSWS